MVIGQSLRRILSIPKKLEPENELMEKRSSHKGKEG